MNEKETNLKDVNYVSVGEKITEKRLKNGVEKDYLAKLANLTVNQLDRIESATDKVDLPTLVKIANSLGVSLDEILCDSLKAPYTILLSVNSDGASDSNAKDKSIIDRTVETLKNVFKA